MVNFYAELFVITELTCHQLVVHALSSRVQWRKFGGWHRVSAVQRWPMAMTCVNCWWRRTKRSSFWKITSTSC